MNEEFQVGDVVQFITKEECEGAGAVCERVTGVVHKDTDRIKDYAPLAGMVFVDVSDVFTYIEGHEDLGRHTGPVQSNPINKVRLAKASDCTLIRKKEESID